MRRFLAAGYRTNIPICCECGSRVYLLIWVHVKSMRIIPLLASLGHATDGWISGRRQQARRNTGQVATLLVSRAGGASCTGGVMTVWSGIQHSWNSDRLSPNCPRRTVLQLAGAALEAWAPRWRVCLHINGWEVKVDEGRKRELIRCCNYCSQNIFSYLQLLQHCDVATSRSQVC